MRIAPFSRNAPGWADGSSLRRARLQAGRFLNKRLTAARRLRPPIFSGDIPPGSIGRGFLVGRGFSPDTSLAHAL